MLQRVNPLVPYFDKLLIPKDLPVGRNTKQTDGFSRRKNISTVGIKYYVFLSASSITFFKNSG